MPPAPLALAPPSPRHRWALAPGLHVVRRGHDRLQVGLDPARRLVLPRSPLNLAVLRALRAGEPLPPGVHDALLRRLLEHNLLVAEPRRALGRICVLPAPGSDDLAAAAVQQLQAAGARTTASPHSADVVLVPSLGEPARELLDPLLREGLPHLTVRLVDGAAVVGPFVDPGETACLRCLDAHAADADPEHPAVLGRYVAAGHLAPHDPVLATLAVAWALRDARAWQAGAQPGTWSTTWRLGHGGAVPLAQHWSRHPGCGCTWPTVRTWPGSGAGSGSGSSAGSTGASAAPASGTMGA